MEMAGGTSSPSGCLAREHARRLLAREPARIHDFGGIERQLLAQRLAPTADHQRMRERPGLARDIVHLAHLDAGFFLHLAADSVLDIVAGLHITGQRGVKVRGRGAGMQRQQAAAAAGNEHDNGRVGTRKGIDAARPAMPPPAAVPRVDLAAAARAAAVDRVPGHDGAGLHGDLQLVLAQHTLHRERAQVDKRLHAFECVRRMRRLRRLEVAGEDRCAVVFLAEEDEFVRLRNRLHLMRRKPMQWRRRSVRRRDDGKAQVEQRQHLRVRTAQGRFDIGGIGALFAAALEAGLGGEPGRVHGLLHGLAGGQTGLTDTASL